MQFERQTENRTIIKRIAWTMFMLWAVVSLACNMPAGQAIDSQLVAPADATKQAGEQNADAAAPRLPTITPLATAVGGVSNAGDALPKPTDDATPFVFAPTVTPRGTPDPEQVLATPATPTPAPLTLEYNIDWQLNTNDPNFAFATVTLSASGGEPPYTYFRDNLSSGGPNFSYRWGACVDNPGSFRVDSADGQSFTVDYFEQTPCSN